MVHGAQPVGVRQGLALRFGDRHQWQLVKAPVELGPVGGGQGAVQGVEMGNWQALRQGVVARAGVEVQHIEAIQLIHHLVQLDQLRHGGVAVVARQPQGFGHAGKQLGAGAGVAAGEQHHRMAAPHQFFGEVVHHPFRSAIAAGRDALAERGNLGNSHRLRARGCVAERAPFDLPVIDRVSRCAGAGSEANRSLGAALGWIFSRMGHP